MWWAGRQLWHIREMPGGKLWSIRFVVPSCPSRSLTSVAAIQYLVARYALEKGRLDPAGEFVNSCQLSRAWHISTKEVCHGKAQTVHL